MPRPTTALISINGSADSLPRPAALPVTDMIVAVDGGLRHLESLGLTADFLIGDLDSVEPHALEAATRRGTTVERHPAAKDHSDLELALRLATVRNVDQIIVIGAFGGRHDHEMVNVAVCSSPLFATVRIELLHDQGRIVVVHPGQDTRLNVGKHDLVSLLAIGGPAEGVTTSGLQWPLSNATLHPGSSRGLSNVAQRLNPTVAVTGGTLLAMTTTVNLPRDPTSA